MGALSLLTFLSRRTTFACRLSLRMPNGTRTMSPTLRSAICETYQNCLPCSMPCNSSTFAKSKNSFKVKLPPAKECITVAPFC